MFSFIVDAKVDIITSDPDVQVGSDVLLLCKGWCVFFTLWFDYYDFFLCCFTMTSIIQMVWIVVIVWSQTVSIIQIICVNFE